LSHYLCILMSSRDKRTYEAMQGANSDKLPKKLKLVTGEAAAPEANTDENFDHDAVHERSVVDKTPSCELVRDDPTTGPATLETTNNPTATEPNIMEQSSRILGLNSPVVYLEAI
jgi:hypothetical protein